mmetsp:Transcript_52443/g.126967  ORF Transcript_52443/g.126967 Transcript_52443/m.126967 type:complete len:114 (-) Transcript_52443:1387-1728(-)
MLFLFLSNFGLVVVSYQMSTLAQTLKGFSNTLHATRVPPCSRDYPKKNGNSKQMIMTAFPSLTQDDKLTPENIEGYSLRVRHVMDRYDQIEEYRPRYDLMAVIGTGVRPQFYS